MPTTFNDFAKPKVETKRFKLYADVSGSANEPTWELQGRGVESWTVEENEDITKTPDVLGFIDMERGTAQQTQTGVKINVRKDSKFGLILFNAWFNHDKSALDAVKFLQKFEFIDGDTPETCKAKIEKDVMVAITSFEGEAGGYLAFVVDFHYSNNFEKGTMPKVDGDPIKFTPDSATAEETTEATAEETTEATAEETTEATAEETTEATAEE